MLLKPDNLDVKSKISGVSKDLSNFNFVSELQIGNSFIFTLELKLIWGLRFGLQNVKEK